MQKLYNENNVQEVAEAIRDRNQKETQYKLREMPEAIKELPSVQEYDELKSYIPKTTSEDGICENAIPLNASAEVDGNSKQELLPSEYQQIEYIKGKSYAKNSNYINTEIYPNNNTSIELAFKFDATDTGLNYDRIMGSSDLFRIEQGAIDWNRLYISYNNITYTVQNINLTEKHIVKQEKNKFFIDGTLINQFAESTFTDGNALRLLSDSKGDRDSRVKLFYCKIWESNTLVRNFIPCYRKSNNEIGLYDLVEGKFYTNQGTGEFLKGADVISPSPSIPVEIEVIDGYNMVDYSKFVKTGGVGDYTYTKNTITVEYLAPYVAVKQDIPILNKKYIISVDLITKGRLEISLFKNGTKIGNTETTTSTFTIDNINNTYDTVRIALSNANYSENITFTNLMMVEGTTSKPYLPYGHIGLLQRGKNEAKIKEQIKVYNSTTDLSYFGVNYTSNDNGFTLDGTLTGTNTFRFCSIDKLNAGEYKFIIKNISGNINNYIYFTVKDNNGNIINQIDFNGKDINSIFTLSELKENLNIDCYIAKDRVFTNNNFQILIQKSNITDDTYEPYHEPILHDIDLNGNTIAKVGDVKDLLSISEKGIVELEKKIATTTFDGSDDEDWGKHYSAIYQGKALFKITLEHKDGKNISNIFNNVNGFSDNYPEGICTDSTALVNKLGIIILAERLNNIYTVAKLKEWLSQNKIKIYYLLATPQKLTLPTTEPIKMWEGTNIFEFISNLDTTYRIKYYIDYNSILNGIQTALLDAEPEI